MNFQFWAPKYESRLRDIMDGTSNTVILCETHIHQNMLDKSCGHGVDSVPSDKYQAGRDGNIFYYHGNFFRDYSTQSSARFRIARGPADRAVETYNFDDRGGLIAGGPVIGSWHPGIVIFLMADGSVHSFDSVISISLTKPPAHISDGQVIQLP